MQSIAVEETKSDSEIDFQKLQKSVAELQTSLAVVNGEKENLQKFNTNLQNIANDRALALSEIKEEKNLWQSKYENLQTHHNGYLEKSFRKYYHLF